MVCAHKLDLFYFIYLNEDILNNNTYQTNWSRNFMLPSCKNLPKSQRCTFNLSEWNDEHIFLHLYILCLFVCQFVCLFVSDKRQNDIFWKFWKLTKFFYKIREFFYYFYKEEMFTNEIEDEAYIRNLKHLFSSQ